MTLSENNNKKNKLIVINNDQTIDEKRLTISDVYASVSYYLNLLHAEAWTTENQP